MSERRANRMDATRWMLTVFSFAWVASHEPRRSEKPFEEPHEGTGHIERLFHVLKCARVLDAGVMPHDVDGQCFAARIGHSSSRPVARELFGKRDRVGEGPFEIGAERVWNHGRG